MSKTSWLRMPYIRWPVRSTGIAVVGPGIITSLAALPGQIPVEIASLLYVPAVVGAAAVGGPISGLGAALLSFLALNYYFRGPISGLGIDNPSDLISLTVFMIVALAIGMLLASALASRERTAKREMEARLLNRLATRLLSGEAPEIVLTKFAESVVEMFDLAGCVIRTDVTTDVIVVGDNDGGGERYVAPMVSKDDVIGRIELVTGARRNALDPTEREVFRGFAGQVALALEGVRLSEEVRGARLDAEANRLRATLFSSVTHDLRTPLSSITAAVTSLLDRESHFTPETHEEHLEMIRQEAQRLNRMVANLLDMSRMRAGVLVPSKVPASVDEVIESVLSRLRPHLRLRHVRVALEENLPEVPMDVVQIDQVLTNLIENAVKFSPEGSPIEIAAGRTDRGVRVLVADNGPGIPAEERERLFEPFERGDGQQGPGTGLGLAIAKAIVVAHGGSIWVEEVDGSGLAVAFELVSDDAAPGNGAAAAPDGLPRLEGAPSLG
ncbi:MAG TPA: ATP-binding protein [Actinomycetota bacterium]|nr:ATP-binding protein [Actinomycetota bacterium]